MTALTRRKMMEQAQGEPVYISSTGREYTPIMTIDVTALRSSGYSILALMQLYGSMPYLEELTITGGLRMDSLNTKGAILNSNRICFSTTNYPLLRKLHIEPTSIRQNNGAASSYAYFSVNHNNFNQTNLAELTLGRLGGPYFTSGGYFREDMPMPPGTSQKQTGSAVGLTLKVYVASDNAYLARGGFANTPPAPNTTIICYDYATGEVLAA